ncbi:MAG: metal-dependent hydrolase [Novosphingobium sp.]
MDNLTHSLIGAALGQAGLKRKTGLAMPALIIAANLPDIDAACFFWLDGTEHLGFRRGITHGPIAMALLPLLLAGALWGYDRWQTQRGTRPAGRLPVHLGWLFALSLIGCLSHPLFDWFNNYGVRFLEPFSSTWFYGDTLFIIDVWMIVLLGSGIWISRRQEKAGWDDSFKPSRLALAATAGYIALNMFFSDWSEGVGEYYAGHPQLVVANPVPIAFWERDVLIWGDRVWGPTHYYKMRCHMIFGCEKEEANGKWVLRPTNITDPRIAEWAKGDPQAQAFLFWSRMPVAQVGPKGILLTDQRFMDSPARSSFTVELKPR